MTTDTGQLHTLRHTAEERGCVHDCLSVAVRLMQYQVYLITTDAGGGDEPQHADSDCDTD